LNKNKANERQMNVLIELPISISNKLSEDRRRIRCVPVLDGEVIVIVEDALLAKA
jgi:hypothetical protein